MIMKSPVSAVVTLSCAVKSAWMHVRRKVFAHAVFRKYALLIVLALGMAAIALVMYGRARSQIVYLYVFYIDADNIAAYLVRTNQEDGGLHNNVTCDLTTAAGVHATLLTVNQAVDDEQLAALARTVSHGGEWAPADCVAQHYTAVVVCYRDRATHLRVFLLNMHRYLQQQNVVRYRVFVVEQTEGKPFNRGKLFNVGYREVCSRFAVGCFVFHDVDLLPQHPGHVYGCTSCPRHMSGNVDKNMYLTPYRNSFGGVVAITRDQFHAANGYSNEYFGWGSEDDDLYYRMCHVGHLPCRLDSRLSRYTMLNHTKAEPNPKRDWLIKTASNRFEIDGLNSLTYELLAYEELPLYTHILVKV